MLQFLDPIVKKNNLNGRFDIIVWTFQPTLVELCSYFDHAGSLEIFSVMNKTELLWTFSFTFFSVSLSWSSTYFDISIAQVNALVAILNIAMFCCIVETQYFGWVLWHINHCRLFNAKSRLDIYIKYIIWKRILLIMFLNEPELFLHTIKWFQVLLCITNNSIKLQSFVYPQLDGQTILFLTIQHNISHFLAHSLNVKQFYLTHR